MPKSVIILLAALFTRLPSLFTNFYNPDETCYATIGQRLLEGKRLYVDIIDHKPPIVYYLYALFERAYPGNAVVAAHYGMVLIVAATGWFISAIVRRLGGDEGAGLLAALLYVVGASLGKPNDVMAANAELLFNLPLSIFILFLLKGRPFVSGTFVAVAALIKPQAFLPVIAGIIYILFYYRSGWLDRIKGLLCLVAGTAVPLLIVAVWLFSTDRLADAWYWGVSVNSLYMKGHESGIELFMRFSKQTGYMFAEQFGIWLPLIISWSYRGSPKYPLLLWWLTLSVIAVLPGRRFFGHYYLQLLPALSAMSALAYSNVISSLPLRRWVSGVSIFAVSTAFVISWVWAWPVDNFRKKLEPVEKMALIEYLKRVTLPGEKIEVWGRFNGIPYLVGRENGSMFLNKNLLSGSFRSKEPITMPDKHWDLYLGDLRKNRPEWFVDHSAVDMQAAPIDKFPRLREYIKRNYIRVAEIDRNVIYRWRALEDYQPSADVP